MLWKNIYMPCASTYICAFILLAGCVSENDFLLVSVGGENAFALEDDDDDALSYNTAGVIQFTGGVSRAYWRGEATLGFTLGNVKVSRPDDVASTESFPTGDSDTQRAFLQAVLLFDFAPPALVFTQENEITPFWGIGVGHTKEFWSNEEAEDAFDVGSDSYLVGVLGARMPVALALGTDTALDFRAEYDFPTENDWRAHLRIMVGVQFKILKGGVYVPPFLSPSSQSGQGKPFSLRNAGLKSRDW